MKYIIESFEKFRKDALSKLIYDILKYVLIGIILIQLLKYIPIVKEFLTQKIEVSLWLLISLILTTIFLVFILYYFKFQAVLNELKEQNQFDELTNLKNHKALEERFDLIFNNSQKLSTSFILMDIDNFKKFNEDFSYDIADIIMAKLGDLLKRDSRITDEVYRYYLKGDEFLIIATETNISNAQVAADRKRQLIQDTNFNINGEIYRLTVSCGVTELLTNDSKELLKDRLNQALKKAKKNQTKNKVEIII